MKNRECWEFRSILVAILIFGLSSITNHSSARDIYVSASAAAAVQDGTLGNPFRTIQQASDVAVFGDVIHIRGGVYREQVMMKENGVTYQAYQNETVTISGTEILTGWTLSGSVYTTKMEWDAPEANQLFIDGKMINLARWPDQTSNNLITPTDGVAENVTASGNNFIIKDDQFNEPDGRWTGAYIWVNLSRKGTDGMGWTGRVVSTSQAAKTITVDFGEPPRMGDQPWSVGTGTEFYMYNPTEAGVNATGGISVLLGPGEWWKNGNDIYVRAPNGGQPNPTSTNVVEAKKREFAFRSSDPLQNRSSYTIRNLNLFACSIVTDEAYLTRNNSIVDDAHDITIDGIKAKYLSHFTDQTGNWQTQWSSNTGIVLSGRNNTIKNCSLQYSAGPAVCILGAGNKMLNNVITEANYSASNSGAVNTEAICLDCEIAYNTISHTTVMALNIKGLRNSNPAVKGIARIHHNKIFNFMMRSADSGGIDEISTEADWVRIDHNILYNTRARDMSTEGIYGIYFDFSKGEYFVDHNLVYNVHGAMIVNNTPLLSIYNNTLISTSQTYPAIINGNQGVGLTDTIRNNILSAPPNLTGGSGNLSQAVIQNNITNANGAVLSGLFASHTIGNYQLKSSASAAIDQGRPFPYFNETISGNAIDLGAFEFGVRPWKTGKPVLPSPAIKPNGGDFYQSVTVEISSDTTNAALVIRYTTDGTDPTSTSTIYTQPLTLTDSRILKARLFASPEIFSEVAIANLVVSPPLSPDQLMNASTPSPVENGIIAKYYEWSPADNYTKIPDLTLLTPARIDTTNLSIGLDLPHADDYFIFDFEGYIDVPADGPYTFFTNSDDNCKLYINDSLVVDSDFIQGPTERSGTVGLRAGKHKIRVQFMEVGGGEVLQVAFKGPNISRNFISPASLWYLSKPSVAISPASGTYLVSAEITLQGQPAGSTVYYTLDGSTPSESSDVYTGPFTINNSLTLSAIASKDGVKGKVKTAAYIIAGPEVNILPAGSPFYEMIEVALTSNPAGAVLYYTTDGSTPTTSSSVYTDKLLLTSTTTIKALAVMNGKTGEIREAVFTQTAGPIVLINPVGGVFQGDVEVSISSVTPDVAIHYTIDGSEPTTQSPVYTGPFLVTETTTVKAFATKGTDIGETVTAQINIGLITSNEPVLADADLEIYPNPVNGESITLRINGIASKGHLQKMGMFDTYGRLVFQRAIDNASFRQDEITFDLPLLPAGLYMVFLSGKQFNVSRKLIVKH